MRRRSSAARTIRPAASAALTEVTGPGLAATARQRRVGRAARNQPVTTGDRLATDAGARAELHVGSTTLRLDARSELEVARLDDEPLRAACCTAAAPRRACATPQTLRASSS